MLTSVDGRRMVTPMLIVMITIGTTDLVFALDSIPAIFGVTREPYLVFTANAFALMGLRQLYFLIGGLLERLVYLSVGLGLVLGFVGGKMVVEALAENRPALRQRGPTSVLGTARADLAFTHRHLRPVGRDNGSESVAIRARSPRRAACRPRHLRAQSSATSAD